MASFLEGFAEHQRRERKAKAILTAAIRADSSRFKTRTLLYKVFWTSHVNHMAVHGVHLSDWPIVRLPNGPAPNDGKQLLERLELDGLIRQQAAMRFGRTAHEATIADAKKADEFIASQLSASEVASIETMAKHLQDTTATAISEWSHQVSRAWREAGRNGAQLDIDLDLITGDEEYEELRSSLEAGKHLADDIFGKP